MSRVGIAGIAAFLVAIGVGLALGLANWGLVLTLILGLVAVAGITAAALVVTFHRPRNSAPRGASIRI